MSAIKFDVALEVSKLRSDPAIFAIPAILAGENSKNSRNSRPAPPVALSPPPDLDAPSGYMDLNQKNALPSREACQGQGCAMWLSGGPDDPACAWRCIGSIVLGGMDPEGAHKPRLAGLDRCPHGKLNTGTGLDDWPPFPPEGVDIPAYEAAGSLLDLCRRHGLRVEVTDGKARIIYPVGASEALRKYAATLLAEAREFIERMQNVVGDAPTEVHQ